MNRPAFRRARGLLLVELLVALALTALMLAPLAGLLRNTAGAAAEAANRVALARDADFALERIAAVVRATSGQLLPAPTWPSTTSGTWFAVSFSFNGSQLTQQGTGAASVLADGVTAFSITAPAVECGQQLVQVSLTIARGGASNTTGLTLRLGGAR